MDKRGMSHTSSGERGAARARPGRQRGRLLLAALLLAVLGPDASCRAGLIIAAPNVSAAPGSSGSFDVLIMNSIGSGASFDVFADTVGLSLSGPSGVTFTGVSIDTVAASYIYVLSGTTLGVPLSFDTFPNTQFDAFDSEFGPLGFRTISPGETFGLVNVAYTVDPNASAGAGTLTITTDTSLSDPTGANIAFTPQDGVFIVSAVPEPSAVALLTIGCAAVVACSARKRSPTSKR
jgi:hypothetical protein